MFETEKPICISESLGFLSLIGTRYEHLLDKIKPGDMTAFHKGDLSKSLGFTDFISKKDMQNLVFLYYEKIRDLIDKDNHTDTLINLRKYYNCPAPVI